MNQLPVLYHKGKNGELRQWRCWADADILYTEHGCVDGVLQTSSKKCTPKNFGKKNATSAEEQAVAEAQSLHTFKLERKYSSTKEEAQMPSLLPMLAHKYDPKKHKGGYYCQPKLDGTRALARWENDKVVLYSRSGKVYDVKHITDELASFMGKDDVLDGELYIHGLPLQSIVSLIKKPQEKSKLLQYWIYDMPTVNGDETLSYNRRKQRLANIFDNYYESFTENMSYKDLVSWQPENDSRTSLIEVDTYWLDDVSHVKQELSKSLEKGFEGLMLRHSSSEYLWGYRSNELLKVKEFQDSEFEITDIIEGEGKMTGCAIFVCQNDLTNSSFKAVPKMSMEERAEIFQNKQDYIGKMVTVKYFDRTEDLIVRFPVALSVRDYD